MAPSLLAVVLWWVPGFDVLDYHGCLALAPVCGIAAAWAAIEVMRGRAGKFASWLPLIAVGPTAIAASRGLVAPWCDPATGLLFAALGPWAATIVGVCWGVLGAHASIRRAGWVVAGLFIATALPPLWFFYHHPQAFGFHPLVGWIAGPLYEDAVRPGWAYLAFRLLDLAAWPTLTIAAVMPSRRRIAGVVAVTAVAVFIVRAGPEGWLVSTRRVTDTLSVRAEVNVADPSAPRPAVVLHMPRGSTFRKRAHLLIEDTAVRYMQLQRFFGAPAGETLKVFVYPDRRRKRRLMGAERVELAKPWLRQVHIVWPGYGASVLTHELAHAFSADLAAGPLNLPMRSVVVPDALLIEGLAVAAEWPIRERLTPHQWARAMRRLGLAPAVQSLFSPRGFFAHSGARSYTIAGSLLRWLRDVHGDPALRKLYATADIGEATGSSADAVFAAWAAFVDSDAAGPLSQTDMARAEARFERAAFFFRPCPLHVGRQHRESRRLFALGLYGQRAELLADLLATLSDHTDGCGSCDGSHWRAAAVSAAQAGDFTGAREFIADGRRRGRYPNRFTQQLAARLEGDVLFRTAATEPADRDSLRRTSRKRWQQTSVLPQSAQRGMDLRRVSQTAANLLAVGPPILRWGDALDRARSDVPKDAAIAYLWVRHHLLDADRPDGFDAAMDQTSGLSPRIRAEVDRMRALDHARQGRCDAIGGKSAYVSAYRQRCDDIKRWRAGMAGQRNSVNVVE